MRSRVRAWIMVGLGLGPGLGVACGDDGPTQTPDDSTGSDASTSGPTDPTTTSGPEDTSGGSGTSGDSTTGADSTTGDALPDYTDSPCWGEASSTSVYNGMTHMTEQTPATCRAEGDRVLLYVADSLWEGAVDQAAVNGLMHQLELFSPAGSVDPDQGVVPNDEAVFGPLDEGDFPQGKLEIFVVDTNGGGDGYLCSWCTYPQLHLDGTVLQPLDDAYSVSIAAHETYHVIHEAYDANETMWVDESLAEAAMTANGFFTDTAWLDDFAADPDQNWGPGSPALGGFNYGAALLWGSFLWERGGAPLMTAITAEPTDGWVGLDAALDAVGDDRDAFDLYLDMIVAAYLDDPGAGYGFTSFEVPPMAVAGDLMVGSAEAGSLSEYGIDYWDVLDTGMLTIDLAATGAEPVVGQAVVVTGGGVQVIPLGPATPVDATGASAVFVALTARDVATYDLSVN
ncbi:MAG: hypothetical protein KDK70_28400 [Myxococcales bacterium]|nr:hypothetical protein [Myxococcales bacterium]